jgi:hypothetical protein
VLAVLAALALRAARLWWPMAPGGLRFMDHSPLYFVLALAYGLCAGALGVAIWRGSRWLQSLVYWWAAILTCLTTALLLYDPFGRVGAGRLILALEVLGVLAFVAVLRLERRAPTDPVS